MSYTTFKHSGNIGDTIYALSAISQYCEFNGTKAILYLHLNQPSTFTDKTHPVGNVMLNQTIFDLAYLLLLSQPYIEKVETYTGQDIDFDMDIFRKENKNLSAGDIKLWHCVAYPELRVDVTKQALFVQPIPNDYIIVNRTIRYNNPLIDYSILDQFDNVMFVGVEDEYKIMRAINPKIEHLKVDSFLQLAGYIAGCKVFIGNQSMAFAIAEQLKVRRILEQYMGAPNVIPQGGEWWITQTKNQFENTIKKVIFE